MSMLHVEVETLKGEHLDLRFRNDALISDLKDSIADSWSIPAVFQRLVLGRNVQHDLENVASGSYCLIVSLDIISQQLKSTEPFLQEEALAQLCDLGQRGGTASLSLVRSCLDSSTYSCIRKASVEAVALIARGGDEAAVAALRPYLADDDPEVRCSVVAAVARIATKDYMEKFTWLEPCLHHDLADVRKEAVKQISQFETQTHHDALNLLVPCLDCPFMDIRLEVVEAILQKTMLQYQDMPARLRAFTEIAPRLKDVHASVRQASIRAMRQLSDRGNGHMLSIVRPYFEHRSANVRQAAADVFSGLAEAGDPEIMLMLSARLRDACPQVRVAAINSLVEMYEKRGDDCKVEALTTYLSESDDIESSSSSSPLQSASLLKQLIGVRVAAVNALGQVSGTGNCSALSVLRGQLCHSSALIQKAAADAIAKVALPGDEQSISSLIACLKTAHTQGGQKSAILAIAQLASQGDQSAKAAVAAHLEDKDSDVAAAAAHAVSRLDEQTVRQAASKTKQMKQLHLRHVMGGFLARSSNAAASDSDRKTDRIGQLSLHDCTAETVKMVAVSSERGDQSLIAALALCLEGRPARVRQAAIEALGNVAKKGDQHAVNSLIHRSEQVFSELRASHAASLLLEVTACIKALVNLSTKGDSQVVATVVKCLQNARESYSDDGLSWVHCHGNEMQLRTMICAAMAALARVANKGDGHAIAELFAHLDHFAFRRFRFQQRCPFGIIDSFEGLREAAVRKLIPLLDESDRATSLRLLAQLRDPSARVRQAVLSGVQHVWRRGDQYILAALVQHLQRLDQEYSPVRAGVLKIMANLAELGNGHLRGAVIACLGDASTCVREAAVDVAALIGETTTGEGDKELIDALATCRVNQSVELRQRVDQALAKLACSKHDWLSPADARGAEAHLRTYFLGLARGYMVELPFGYVSEGDSLKDTQTGVILHGAGVLCGTDRTDLANCTVLYHFTTRTTYERVVSSRPAEGMLCLVESGTSFASFGHGLHASRKPPCQYHSKREILLNNFSNSSDPCEQEQEIQRWLAAGAADYCIALCVPVRRAIDVSRECTRDMATVGHTAYTNQRLRADRDLWVVQFEGRLPSQTALE